MAKGKKSGSSSGSSAGTNGRGLITLSPERIYFTHSRVRPQFTGCNKVIADTLKEIVEGRTRVTDIPMITVIENDGNYFSLNNRRLYLFKELLKLGLIPSEGVLCQLKPALEREKERYTPARCSLKAKLMGRQSAASEGADDLTNVGDAVNEGDVEDETVDAIATISESTLAMSIDEKEVS